MTRSDNDRVCEFFARVARDVTPVSARPVARVLYAPFTPDSGVVTYCNSILSEAERQRADRFATEFGQALFLQRRAFRRYCAAAAFESSMPLSRISFSKTEKNRPYVADAPDSWFSFSSCRLGFLGAWSSTHGVGVDLEDPARKVNIMGLAQTYFSPAEAAAIQRAGKTHRLSIFFQLWNLKEAALKSIGEGLPFGLGAFEFEPGGMPLIVKAPSRFGGPDRFSPHLIDGITGCAALVVRELT